MRGLAGVVLFSLTAPVAANEPAAPGASRPGFSLVTQESHLEQIVKDNWASARRQMCKSSSTPRARWFGSATQRRIGRL
jgi:hypothetical protein